MKIGLTLIGTFLLSISTFAQIENFSWLASRDGYTSYEVSDVYTDGSVISAGSFYASLDGDPGINQTLFTAPQFGTSTFVQKLNPDGTLAWVNEYKGGEGSLQLWSMCVDVFGNSYITGTMNGLVDFDPNSPGYELSNSYIEIVLLSLDSEGNFRWVNKLGGGAPDMGRDIKTDLAGNVFLFGSLYYDYTDFDPGIGVFQLPSKIGYTSFVEKLTTNGEFVWARRTIGGDRGRIEVDNQSNVYLLNTLNGFAITPDGDTLESGEKTDILIQKLDPTGNYEWIRNYGNDVMLGTSGIAVDKDMNIYCQANFGGSLNVDPGNSELIINETGSYDVFIQKLSSDGSMIWTKVVGGVGTELARDITISPDNHIYSIGSFVGNMDFDPSSTEDDLYSSMYNDGYLAKFDLNGQFIYSVRFGAEKEDYGERIHCDSNNNVLVHGRYSSELAISTDQGNRIVSANGNYFLMKFGDPNVNDENHLYIGLSPNPVENIVSIDQLDVSEFAQLESSIEIRIYDDLGRLIIETTSNSAHTEIDLSIQRVGTYLIEVRRGNDRFLERVVKTAKQQ